MVEPPKTNRPRVVILLGPTGVGKSKLAMELAEHLGGEIVSADSMQVYKYMDIGTAKPTPEDRARVKHHLVDVVRPDQAFHAGLYRSLGRRAVDQLVHEGKPVWVVGGTGLYIKALTQGLFSIPGIDPVIRERLNQEAKERGVSVLHERLKRVDPKAASGLHPHDLVRTRRALEVFESTGVPISFYRDQHRFGDKPYVTLRIGLDIDRETLYREIDQRVDRMITQGFLEEVRRLLEMGFGSELKPMQSLGYKQMVQYLMNEIEWDAAVKQIKRDTRRYAKRQWTWFKADPEVHWWNPVADRERIVSEVASFLGTGS